MTLNLEKQPIDHIIEQHFPKDIQQKRIRKELLSLNELDQEAFKISLLNSSLGLKVIVELSPNFLEHSIQTSQSLHFPIIFELLLDPQFPFNLPKLFCQTNVYEPSLADGRDFLEDTIEKQWSPTILLREVIGALPHFLKKIVELNKPEDSQSLGKYHIGELYNLEDLLGYENIVLFSGEEVLPNKKLAPRYLMVAESFFLMFETVDKAKNMLRLLDFTNIQAIINLKKGKDVDRSIVLTFTDKEKQGGVAQYKFVLNEAAKLMEVLINMGQKYGVKITGTVKKNLDISYYSSRLAIPVDEDNIEETLEDINELESKLEKEISKDVVYTLMAYYQKVVEHFATFDDPLVTDFVRRLRGLMEREDVQNTLANTQEEVPKSQKLSTKKVTEDTDIDEEEKKETNDQPFIWSEGEREIISEGFSRPEPREEIFIRDNRADEQRNEEKVKKANLPPAEEEWGEYEENTTQENQVEEKHEIQEQNGAQSPHEQKEEIPEGKTKEEQIEEAEYKAQELEREEEQQGELPVDKEQEIKETEEVKQEEPVVNEEVQEGDVNQEKENVEEGGQKEATGLQENETKEEVIEPEQAEQIENREEKQEEQNVVNEEHKQENIEAEDEKKENQQEVQEKAQEVEPQEGQNEAVQEEKVDEEPKNEEQSQEQQKEGENVPEIQEKEPEEIQNVQGQEEENKVEEQNPEKDTNQDQDIAKETEAVEEKNEENELEQKTGIEQNKEEEKEAETVEEKNEEGENENEENESPEKTEEPSETEEKKEGGGKKKKKKNKKK